jgi:diacylglycerol O-acyltransferase / wax synthase
VPMADMDPRRRLGLISAETARVKAKTRPSLGKMPTGRWFGRVVLKVITSHPVNVTTADVPGPEFPLYLAGAQLLEVFPIIPLVGNVSLGVGAISYAGQFNLGVVADRDTYPDVDVFAGGVRDELDRLAATVPSPGSQERLAS